jgi:IS605 OrfB family transposase
MPEYFQPLLAWDFQGMTLCYQDKQFFAKLVFETEDPKLLDPKIIVGIDRGLSHMAVLSNGKFFSSQKANAGQRRYLHNRRTAQVKGTPSARRRLKRMSGKEQRFNRDVNHCVTKAIVHGGGETFVLENLQGIRALRRSRKMNKRLASWPFYQFGLFLTYKAQALGKSVVYVNARHTSQRCSRCHHTERANRKGAVFHCCKCGLRMHADLNAAINIRDRYLLSLLLPQGNLLQAGEQGAVNHPGITEAWPMTMLQIPSDATISASVRKSVASHGPRARGS